MKTLRMKGWAGAPLFVISLWIYWTNFYLELITILQEQEITRSWCEHSLIFQLLFFSNLCTNLFILQDGHNRPLKKVTICQMFEMYLYLTFIWLFSSNLPHQAKRIVTFYPCKHARIESSACTCVLCHECYNKMTEGDVEAPKGGRRTSRRTVKADQTGGLKPSHQEDSNGCTHSDPSSFQLETNQKYYDERYRAGTPKNKQISCVCLRCEKNVLG